MIAHQPMFRSDLPRVHFARGLHVVRQAQPSAFSDDVSAVPPSPAPSGASSGAGTTDPSAAAGQQSAAGDAGGAQAGTSAGAGGEAAGSQIPACVGNCILLGDFTECGGSATDLTCLCGSPKFHSSVDACFTAQCTPDQAAIGAQYAQYECARLGVNSTTVVVPQPSSTAIDTFTPPDVYSQTFVNLQAIMSSLCAALILIALIVGFFSIRSRRRRDAGASGTDSGAYTHMATMASRHGPGGTKSFTTSRGGGFDPTATFASASYPSQTKSFGDVTIGSGLPALGGGRAKGFSNRMRLDEQEEWELEEQERKAAVGGAADAAGAAGPGGLDRIAEDEDKFELTLGEDEAYMRKLATEGLPDSPVTPTTIRSHGEETDEYGSTVLLHRLDKGDGTSIGRAI